MNVVGVVLRLIRFVECGVSHARRINIRARSTRLPIPPRVRARFHLKKYHFELSLLHYEERCNAMELNFYKQNDHVV